MVTKSVFAKSTKSVSDRFLIYAESEQTIEIEKENPVLKSRLKMLITHSKQEVGKSYVNILSRKCKNFDLLRGRESLKQRVFFGGV